MIQPININDKGPRRPNTVELSIIGKAAGAEQADELRSRRQQRPFTQEETRQATENVSGFFALLSAWDAARVTDLAA
jgi:hypothetical protein